MAALTALWETGKWPTSILRTNATSSAAEICSDELSHDSVSPSFFPGLPETSLLP
jgi:hypothetical protein